MPARDTFSLYHPMVNFVYFALVLAFSLWLNHPAAQVISLLCAFAYGVCLAGFGDMWKQLRLCLPIALLASVINPLFSHAGMTILGYFPSGNPLTLESILYGLSAAGLLLSALVWFFCCTRVLTTDKFLYLFGRILPALSLLLSMTLRFVPQCRRKFQAIREGQRCLGQANDGALLHKTRQTAHALSILITWSLEDAADTASSMKSRGYGLPGRSSFSIYRFENRDLAVLAWMIGCGALVLGFGLSGALAWRYYPTVKGAPLTASQLLALLCHAFLCLTPVYLSAREGLRWKHLSSGM